MSKSNYGLFEIIKNICDVINTKIFFRKARLIRSPIVIRGKKYIDFGENITLGQRCRFEVLGKHKNKILKFGKNVNIGYDVRISCINKVQVGDEVLMGSKVLIIDNCHGTYKGLYQDSPSIPPNKRNLSSKEINIENNVWIGENSVIQMGVTIGFGSIIAANSVVTKNIPEKCIAAGSPAKIIKIFDDKMDKWVKI